MAMTKRDYEAQGRIAAKRNQEEGGARTNPLTPGSWQARAWTEGYQSVKPAAKAKEATRSDAKAKPDTKASPGARGGRIQWWAVDEMVEGLPRVVAEHVRSLWREVEKELNAKEDRRYLRLIASIVRVVGRWNGRLRRSAEWEEAVGRSFLQAAASHT